MAARTCEPEGAGFGETVPRLETGMIDAAILPLQRRVLTPPGRWLVARGIHADQLSLAGFALGVLAVPALAFGAYGLALALLALNRLADGLDGTVARLTGPTDRGAFLDIALDFVFYALFPLGFALANPAVNALPAAVLIAAFVGTGSSFLAFAAIAAKRGGKRYGFSVQGDLLPWGPDRRVRNHRDLRGDVSVPTGFRDPCLWLCCCLCLDHGSALASGLASLLDTGLMSDKL